MVIRRRKKFSLPKDLTIPGGLSTEETKEAVKIFYKLEEKHPDVDIKALWDKAITLVIAVSEDFEEVNGALALIRYHFNQRKQRATANP